MTPDRPNPRNVPLLSYVEFDADAYLDAIEARCDRGEHDFDGSFTFPPVCPDCGASSESVVSSEPTTLGDGSIGPGDGAVSRPDRSRSLTEEV